MTRVGLVVEQGAVVHGDRAAIGIDTKPATGIVGQRVGEGVGLIENLVGVPFNHIAA